MASKTCPKCHNPKEEGNVCSKCGLNFADYEQAKLTKLAEVHRLLSENRFLEAKQLAEQLPAQFPDKKTDFVLLLSNINRDISIVEKFEQAQRAFSKEDYPQVSLILRNIKAFDSTLNERVVGLRRKAERIILEQDQFSQAVSAFDQGDYTAAEALFKRLKSSPVHGAKVAEYLEHIQNRTQDALKDAVECINTGQFSLAESKFARLQSTNPEIQEVIARYIGLIARRAEIKASIHEAADRARTERRLLEAKILYSYLGMQFPEELENIRPRILEIGAQAVIGLADLQTCGEVDLAGLGIDVSGGGGLTVAAADLDTDAQRSSPATDIPTTSPATASRPSPADEFSPPVELDVEEIPDFIF